MPSNTVTRTSFQVQVMNTPCKFVAPPHRWLMQSLLWMMQSLLWIRRPIGMVAAELVHSSDYGSSDSDGCGETDVVDVAAASAAGSDDGYNYAVAAAIVV